MAGFLSTLTKYSKNKWEEVSRESLADFDAEGFADVESAEVTEKEQEWGMSYSICLYMNGGNEMSFIPLSRDSELFDQVGKEVDLDSIEIITLSKAGEDDIYRADGTVKSKATRRKK